MPPPELRAGGDTGWWAVRFRMEWPPDEPPHWYMDLLLAHQVLLPVLEGHRDEIFLWRFHRRAARDDAGHQFSLIFYAERRTAARVSAEILDAPLLHEAKNAGRLRAAFGDDTAGPVKPGIGDTSDPAWSAALRDAWPHFLMGASRTWLELIAALAAEDSGRLDWTDFHATEQRFQRVNAAINALWQQEGRHAFLHHLNALFGYEPVWIIEKRLMNF
ncbi:MAG: hypothetical protein MUD16_07085 [Desulfobacterales bacterium]|nr:hypothetical protein [Desulfobacterales bacterium]